MTDTSVSCMERLSSLSVLLPSLFPPVGSPDLQVLLRETGFVSVMKKKKICVPNRTQGLISGMCRSGWPWGRGSNAEASVGTWSTCTLRWEYITTQLPMGRWVQFNTVPVMTTSIFLLKGRLKKQRIEYWRIMNISCSCNCGKRWIGL